MCDLYSRPLSLCYFSGLLRDRWIDARRSQAPRTNGADVTIDGSTLNIRRYIIGSRDDVSLSVTSCSSHPAVAEEPRGDPSVRGCATDSAPPPPPSSVVGTTGYGVARHPEVVGSSSSLLLSTTASSELLLGPDSSPHRRSSPSRSRRRPKTTPHLKDVVETHQQSRPAAPAGGRESADRFDDKRQRPHLSSAVSSSICDYNSSPGVRLVSEAVVSPSPSDVIDDLTIGFDHPFSARSVRQLLPTSEQIQVVPENRASFDRPVRPTRPYADHRRYRVPLADLQYRTTSEHHDEPSHRPGSNRIRSSSVVSDRSTCGTGSSIAVDERTSVARHVEYFRSLETLIGSVVSADAAAPTGHPRRIGRPEPLNVRTLPLNAPITVVLNSSKPEAYSKPISFAGRNELDGGVTHHPRREHQFDRIVGDCASSAQSSARRYDDRETFCRDSHVTVASPVHLTVSDLLTDNYTSICRTCPEADTCSCDRARKFHVWSVDGCTPEPLADDDGYHSRERSGASTSLFESVVRLSVGVLDLTSSAYF